MSVFWFKCAIAAGLIIGTSPFLCLAQEKGEGPCQVKPAQYLDALERLAVAAPLARLRALEVLEKYLYSCGQALKERDRQNLLFASLMRAQAYAALSAMTPRDDLLKKALKELEELLKNTFLPSVVSESVVELHEVLRALSDPEPSKTIKKVLKSVPNPARVMALALALTGMSFWEQNDLPRECGDQVMQVFLDIAADRDPVTPVDPVRVLKISKNFEIKMYHPFFPLAVHRMKQFAASRKTTGLVRVRHLLGAGLSNRAQTIFNNLDTDVKQSQQGLRIMGWLQFRNKQTRLARQSWDSSWQHDNANNSQCYSLVRLMARLIGDKTLVKKINSIMPKSLQAYVINGSNMLCWRRSSNRRFLNSRAEVYLDIGLWEQAYMDMECLWYSNMEGGFATLSRLNGLSYFPNFYIATLLHQGSNQEYVESYMGSKGYDPSLVECLPEVATLINDTTIILRLGGAR